MRDPNLCRPDPLRNRGDERHGDPPDTNPCRDRTPGWFDSSALLRRHRRAFVARPTIALMAVVALSVPWTPGISETRQSEDTRDRSIRSERPDFDERSMRQLVGWAAHLSGRELIDDHAVPIAIRLAPGEIQRHVCPERPSTCTRVAAAYNIGRREIIYHHALDPRSLIDRSYLVHELVHSLQHREFGAKINTSCQTILDNEREAYKVQALYLRIHGSNHPVGLDLVGRKCPPEATISAIRLEGALAERITRHTE